MPQKMYDPKVQEKARERARALLSQSPSFRNMDRSEQLAMYKDVVQAQCKELTEKQTNNGGGQLAKQQGLSTELKASDRSDNEDLGNPNIQEAGDLASDFINDVDFPQFVEDLLEGVFDANLNVTLKQMKAYQELLKSATQSLSQFTKEINDEDTFAYLAENNSDFSFLEDDEGGAALADANGEPVDMGDNEVKAKIMDAKLAMAKEQRALLRETILMGVSRLVVERGTVKAAVVFDVKAAEKIDKTVRAADSSTTKSGKTSGGLFFGFYGKSGSSTNKRSKISVSSAKSTATTDLAAQITGSVEIVFKSDYFKLDNFASMYGGEAPKPQGQTGGQPQQPGQYLPGQ